MRRHETTMSNMRTRGSYTSGSAPGIENQVALYFLGLALLEGAQREQGNFISLKCFHFSRDRSHSRHNISLSGARLVKVSTLLIARSLLRQDPYYGPV